MGVIDLLEWCRRNNVAMLKTPEVEVHFAPVPLAPVSPTPPPVIEGFDRMNEIERKAALEQAERERLLFRSS